MGHYSPGGDSPYGCADMAGNVCEWCSSQYVPYPYRACNDRENFETYTSSPVLRGGSYCDDEMNVRCAARSSCNPNNRDLCIGFRVGWEAPSSGL